MPRRFDTRLVLALAFMLGGCGPSEVDGGQAILAAAIPITLIAIALQRAYSAIWRPLEKLEVTWNAIGARVITVLVITLSAALILRGASRRLDDWFLMALALVGASYASLFAVALRATATRRLRRYYPWAIALPWLVLYPPALFYALFGRTTGEVSEAWQMIWILPGWGGLISGPALFLLFAEVGWRRILLARRLKEQEPEFPSAKVHKQHKG